MPRITIKDIAARLSLSPATVSRALAGDSSIRLETRRRVEEAAAAMGYRPNVLAASLRRGRSHNIGVAISEFTPTCCEIIEGIQAVLQPRGITLTILSSNLDPVSELANLQLMQRNMVDGIILVFCHNEANMAEYRHMESLGYPMVFVGSYADGVRAQRILIDVSDRPYFMMDHLIHAGYRRIALVDNSPEVGRTGQLIPSYREALAKFGIEYDPRLVMFYPPGIGSGTLVVDRLMDGGIPFDCIFTYSDHMAVGILNRLRQRGLKVPSEVGVASYYGTGMARTACPQLTCMETDLVRLGRLAAESMTRLLDGAAPEADIVLTPRLAVRGSTDAGAPIVDAVAALSFAK